MPASALNVVLLVASRSGFSLAQLSLGLVFSLYALRDLDALRDLNPPAFRRGFLRCPERSYSFVFLVAPAPGVPGKAGFGKHQAPLFVVVCMAKLSKYVRADKLTVWA